MKKQRKHTAKQTVSGILHSKLFWGAALMLGSTPCSAATMGIDASSGLGYVQYIIMGVGLLFTLIMGISTGFAFRNDAANAKAQLTGTILIPVLCAIVLYIYNRSLGIALNATSSL